MALLILGLWGCSGAPEQKSVEPTPPPVQQPQKPGISLTLPHSEFNVEFSSAEQSLARFDWMAASVALQDVPPEQLTADDRTYLGYLEARIAYSRGYQAQALAQLEQLTYPTMNAALQYRILNFRRHIVEMSGDNLQSARLTDQILRWAPAESAAALKRGIWRDLQRLDTRQLQTAMSAATDPQWHGWLELALLSRESYGLAINDLSVWRNSNAGHPAAAPLPGGLDYLLQQTPPLDKVALMLPLSGRLAPAGKAVRDGYLANYYAARAAGQGDHEVLVLDMDSYESANSAYDDALNQGANLVVGPLSKQAVAELGTRLERPIPVLALNRIDQVLPATGSALVQLSLAPEDEAERIAELAFGQGARAALIVRPAGDWGNKVQQALQTRWAALGGTVTNSVTYTSRDDYSNSVKSALGLPASEQRARDVRSMLATNIEFTARRRQDPDVVFLLSRNGAEARSIKPLLAFHYAGDLPVYATSSIYRGIPDARDRDLNGINLVETPWLLGSNPGLRVAIAAGDTGSDNYTRLNALGADAFLLQSSFRQLQAGPDALLRGDTGLLSMDPQLRIHRELSLATFDGGALKSQ
jgi:outer membrane PBP1 activator LpoA protein